MDQGPYNKNMNILVIMLVHKVAYRVLTYSCTDTSTYANRKKLKVIWFYFPWPLFVLQRLAFTFKYLTVKSLYFIAFTNHSLNYISTAFPMDRVSNFCVSIDQMSWQYILINGLICKLNMQMWIIHRLLLHSPPSPPIDYEKI